MLALDNSDLITIRYLMWVLGGLPPDSRGVAPARRLLERVAAEITASLAKGPATEQAIGLFSEREDSTVIVLEFAADARRAAQVAALRLAKKVLDAAPGDVGSAREELDAAISRVQDGGPLVVDADNTIVDAELDARLRRYLADDN